MTTTTKKRDQCSEALVRSHVPLTAATMSASSHLDTTDHIAVAVTFHIQGAVTMDTKTTTTHMLHKATAAHHGETTLAATLALLDHCLGRR